MSSIPRNSSSSSALGLLLPNTHPTKVKWSPTRYIPVILIPEKLSVEGLKEGTSYCWDSCKDYSNKGSEAIVGGAQYVMNYIPSWQTDGKELEKKESQE